MKIRVFFALALLCVSFSAFAGRRGIVYDGWKPLSNCTVQCGASSPAGSLTDTGGVLDIDGYSLNFGVGPTLPSGCTASNCAGVLAAYYGIPPPSTPNQYWLVWGSPIPTIGTPGTSTYQPSVCCSSLYEDIYVTPVSSTEFTISFAFETTLDTGYKTELSSFSFSGPGGSGSFSAVDLADSSQLPSTSSPLADLIDFDIKNGQVVGMSSGWQAMAAPEIDPASGVGALTLLAGGLVLIRSHLSRRSA